MGVRHVVDAVAHSGPDAPGHPNAKVVLDIVSKILCDIGQTLVRNLADLEERQSSISLDLVSCVSSRGDLCTSKSHGVPRQSLRFKAATLERDRKRLVKRTSEVAEILNGVKRLNEEGPGSKPSGGALATIKNTSGAKVLRRLEDGVWNKNGGSATPLACTPLPSVPEASDTSVVFASSVCSTLSCPTRSSSDGSVIQTRTVRKKRDRAAAKLIPRSSRRSSTAAPPSSAESPRSCTAIGGSSCHSVGDIMEGTTGRPPLSTGGAVCTPVSSKRRRRSPSLAGTSTSTSTSNPLQWTLRFPWGCAVGSLPPVAAMGPRLKR